MSDPRSTILRVAVSVVACAVFLTGIPARAASPFGDTSCSGVRPGAILQAPRGQVYTMGFVFKGTARRKTSYYVTAVGNNVLRAPGRKTWRVGGPQAYDARGKAIGRYVYAVFTDTPNYSTFGLIQLDKKVKPNPQVCHFGGPTNVYGDTSRVPATVEYYGNGFPIDQVSPARTAAAPAGTPNDESAFAEGAFALTDVGDNGAPVLLNGRALGFVDGGVGGGGAGAGFVISRIGPWMAQAERALGITLTLQTAKRL